MIYVQATTFLLAVGLAMCEPPSSSYGVPSTSYGTPTYSNGGGYGNGGGGYGGNGGYSDGGHGHDYENNQPKSYEFGYAVKDDYTGNDYGRKETSDGNTVRGEYRVNLPDGRIQIVTYWADWQTGFHADVRYEGEAKYPDTYKTYGNNGQPSGQYGAPANTYGAPPANSYSSSGSYPLSGGYNNAGNFGSKAPSSNYGVPSY